MKVTIKDIARHAGVSVSAVSIALNNRKGIGETTRAKILQIAKKLNYIPNYAARSLISKHSSIIGVIIIDITDPFFSELAKGIEEQANRQGYSIILCNTGGSIKNERKSIITLMSQGVDGIIIATVLHDDPNLDMLVSEHHPFILVNRIPLNNPLDEKIDHVIIDNYTGGFKAMEHLYRIGHDRIAVLSGSMKVSTIIERTRGVRAAIDHFGIRFDERHFVECDYSRQKAYEATKRLLSLKSHPTAFFAHDDNMALGVREAVLSCGLDIPGDIAIVGFDDSDTSSLTGIELTTVSQKKYEIGSIATDILIKKIESKTPPMVNKVVLDTELVIRKTCGYTVTGYTR